MSKSNFIQKILSEAKTMNELFGLSKSEKEQKALVAKIEQAKREAANYNPANIWKQQADNAKDNKDLFRLVSIATNQAREGMPTVAELLPNLFQLRQGSSNAVSCVYNYKGQDLDGILPANFSFLMDNYMFKGDNWLKYMNHYLDNVLQNK
jgi:hypothetical protein